MPLVIFVVIIVGSVTAVGECDEHKHRTPIARMLHTLKCINVWLANGSWLGIAGLVIVADYAARLIGR